MKPTKHTLVKIFALLPLALLVEVSVYCFASKAVLSAYFGFDIPFNSRIWKETKSDTVRYHMANNVIKILDGTDFDHDKIVSMLGTPTLGYDGKETKSFHYFLKSAAIVGLAMYSLAIDDSDGKIRAYILYSD